MLQISFPFGFGMRKVISKCVSGHVRRSHTIYINGMKSKYLDFITIFVHNFGSFDSTYFTPTFFDMIGICKHEKATSTRNTDLAVIVVEIN
jgi:hypothetical protein